jgi:hypothetical protein
VGVGRVMVSFLILIQSFVDGFSFCVSVSMGHDLAFLETWLDGLGKCLQQKIAAMQQAKSRLVL